MYIQHKYCSGAADLVLVSIIVHSEFIQGVADQVISPLQILYNLQALFLIACYQVKSTLEKKLEKSLRSIKHLPIVGLHFLEFQF